jgi:hypothetical protein
VSTRAQEKANATGPLRDGRLRVPMNHTISDDILFQRSFETYDIYPAAFNHAAHVRLAYIYLCGHSIDEAAERMKRSLLAFLDHFGVDRSRFHATMTRAWLLVVRHFMELCSCSASSREFIAANPRLLDTKIMLRHYSAATLFSQRARAAFVQPDIADIPVLS